MDEEYVTRRKLIKALSWFRNRKFPLHIIDIERSSWLDTRKREYKGKIDHYDIFVDKQDACLQIRIWFTNQTSMESQWIPLDALFKRPRLSRVFVTWSNGDGTWSDFEIYAT